MAWLNQDQLYLKHGTEKTVPNKAGEYRNVGGLREVEVKIDLAQVGTNPTILSDVTFIPAGVRIEEVEVVVTVAATSGGAAALNLGLVRTDRTTAISANGLLAAIALTAIDAAGEKVVYRVGTAGAGSLIGTTTANVGYLTADFDTAAYTAGQIIVRVRYMVP